VVAVARDHLEIHGERVLINGKELERDPVPNEGLTFLGDHTQGRVAMEVNSGRRYLVAYGNASEGGRSLGEFDATISSHEVFILGDNRERAKDSRHFGTIQLADIVGDVEYLYWPTQSWSRFGVANDQLP
jgi:signal peptidase I